ncbi:MAG: patatin, partial [Cellvibrionales bacterium]|nr:patatin [Cellvibrionales bacterium]
MTRWVLSIDGGGIRGIIPALLIAYLEKQTGRPASELFDLIVGTSTGGILALGLAQPAGEAAGESRHTAQQLAELYIEKGAAIFDRGWWRRLRSVRGIFEEAYGAEALESILADTFDNQVLASCRCHTMVTTYDIEQRKPLFIKSFKPQHEAILCRDAARATSAAPTYFEPAVIAIEGQTRALIDGGVFMNSPSVSAYAEARKLFPDDEIAMLSIGTGELTRAIPYEAAKTWGSALWVMSLLDCMFDGVSKAADHQMRLFLGEDYLRLQTPLHYASDDMDDASQGNIRNLKQTAEELI